jgi:membrane protease YdiL (CAAX protease family)
MVKRPLVSELYIPTLPLGQSALRIAGFLIALAILILPLLALKSQLLQLALGTAVFTGLLVIWVRFADKSNADLYGITIKVNSFRDALAGVAIGFLAVAAMFVLALLMSPTPAIVVRGLTIDAETGGALARALLVGFWEEALFRGFLFITLARGFATIWPQKLALAAALAASSILFGLAHSFTHNFNWFAFVILCLNGAVWCTAFLLTKQVWLPFGMHAAWNFCQLKVFGFAMSGNVATASWLSVDLGLDAMWSGGNYGPEAGLLGVIGIAVMFVLTLSFDRLQRL